MSHHPRGRPKGVARKTNLFPIGKVSQAQNRERMEYSAVTVARPMPAPNVAMPIRASLAQSTSVNRFAFSRYFSRLRTYGFAPGNPILQAFNQRYKLSPSQRVPRPVISGGKRSGPLSVSRTPATAKPGSMGAPKRFPKALPIRTNTYRPPVYGEGQ